MISIGYMPDTHGGAYEQPEPDAERSAQFATQLLREAEQAERCGFDGVFVPERHARSECLFPAPLTLLAAIAARTQRVKLGSYVIMPPLYNPVHLAEEAAMIDLLSHGRLILGFGVGYHPRYFDHFGVPIKQREGRFEESLEVMRKAWTTTGPSAHHGRYYHYDAIHLTPKPYQRPIRRFGSARSDPSRSRVPAVWVTCGQWHHFLTPSTLSKGKSRSIRKRQSRPARLHASPSCAMAGWPPAWKKPNRPSVVCGWRSASSTSVG